MADTIYRRDVCNGSSSAYRGMGTDDIQPENKWENVGHRQHGVYVEGAAYADGVFQPANGRRYTVKAGNECKHCRYTCKYLRTAFAEYSYDGILSYTYAEAEPCIIGDRYRHTCDERIYDAYDLGKTC